VLEAVRGQAGNRPDGFFLGPAGIWPPGQIPPEPPAAARAAVDVSMLWAFLSGSGPLFAVVLRKELAFAEFDEDMDDFDMELLDSI